MHAPIGILNRNSTIIISSAAAKSKNMFKSKLPYVSATVPKHCADFDSPATFAPNAEPE